MTLKEKIDRYISEAEEKISQCRIFKKYKKVSFTKEDFWNFTLLKDNNELFLSYDKIIEEKNLNLLIEILRRFENIKIIASSKDYDKLMVDNSFKKRIIVEDDIYNRAYRSDFFMLFKGRQKVFEFVKNFTTARFFLAELEKYEQPLWKTVAKNYETNIKDKNFKKLHGKLIDYQPENALELWKMLFMDCFHEEKLFNKFFFSDSIGNDFVIHRLKYESKNMKLLAKIKILQRLDKINSVQ